MDAVISGRAGTALLVNGQTLLSFDVDEPDTLVPRAQSDLPYLFGDARDLQFLENISQEQVRKRLELEYNVIRALDLSLILMDATLSEGVREEAAAELEELFGDAAVLERLEGILYARPLPNSADITGAKARSEAATATTTWQAMDNLLSRQPFIRDVCLAWDALPESAFGGTEQKAEFQCAAVREGLFRELVRARQSRRRHVSFTHTLVNPTVRTLKKHRYILRRWTSLLQQLPIQASGKEKAGVLVKDEPKAFDIIGDSPRMREIHNLIRRVAPSGIPVFIEGEIGTGKELIARAFHLNSARASAPFVTVNCAGIPPKYLNAELFGYCKGAFIGADRDKRGLIEAATGGTLLLDDVTDMPLDIQVKLLRVLQDRTIRRLGDDQEIAIDFRLITTTKRDAVQAVREGLLREDLYYRISPIKVQVPPLRERTGDVVLLAEEFLRRYATKYNKRIRRISPDAFALMLGYNWPGNVLELEHVIERAVLLCSADRLQSEDLSLIMTSPPRRLPSGSLEDQECDLIQQALMRTGGDVARAALLLKLNQSTLYRKMRRFHLTKSDVDGS
jgi:DNA-binding NtrC family response regulator